MKIPIFFFLALITKPIEKNRRICCECEQSKMVVWSSLVRIISVKSWSLCFGGVLILVHVVYRATDHIRLVWRSEVTYGIRGREAIDRGVVGEPCKGVMHLEHNVATLALLSLDL